MTKTHHLAAKPQLSARYLADFMAATEVGKRSIIQGCKFRPIARIVQHDKAKKIVGSYLFRGIDNPVELLDAATHLRDQMADDDFGREMLDHNADYVERFGTVASKLIGPKADKYAAGSAPALVLNDTTVTVDLCYRLRRSTRTNKLRIGAATLRYAKGKGLSPSIAEWQSAFLFGYLTHYLDQSEAQPEAALCLTIDAFSGIAYPAPTNAVSRFKNMQAACATIAERWPNISPPKGAVI